MLLFLLLGAAVGIALGLTGAGGGILAVPLLVFGAGLGMAQAGPMALIAVGLAAGVGAVLGLLECAVRYRAAALLGVVGRCAAPVGVWLAHQSPEWLLRGGLVAALLLSAKAMLDRSRSKEKTGTLSSPRNPTCFWSASTGRFIWSPACARTFAAIGFISGLMSGLLGVGGGFFIVPMLAHRSNLPLHSIVSTSQAVIALVSISSIFAANARGGFAWSEAMPFAAATVVALIASRYGAARLPARLVQQAFSALCIVIAGVFAVNTWLVWAAPHV